MVSAFPNNQNHFVYDSPPDYLTWLSYLSYVDRTWGNPPLKYRHLRAQWGARAQASSRKHWLCLSGMEWCHEDRTRKRWNTNCTSPSSSPRASPRKITLPYHCLPPRPHKHRIPFISCCRNSPKQRKKKRGEEWKKGKVERQARLQITNSVKIDRNRQPIVHMLVHMRGKLKRLGTPQTVCKQCEL